MPAPHPTVALALALSAIVTGCAEGVAPDSGADLMLRIVGAQLQRGELPDAQDGPSVTFVDFRRAAVRAGEGGVRIAGRTAGDAFAVRIHLDGDRGYWTVPVGVEDPAVAGELTWAAGLDFSARLEEGRTTLQVQAVDGAGRAGAPQALSLRVVSDQPSGALVVSLSWDRQVDADLYVTDPELVTIGPKNVNTFEPPRPGEPPATPEEVVLGGFIDIDSNANCLIDGRRREHAVWMEQAPVGRYEVRVDLASTCGLAERTSFEVEVHRDGVRTDWAGGALYAADAMETGAGGAVPLWVMEFTVEAEP